MRSRTNGSDLDTPREDDAGGCVPGADPAARAALRWRARRGLLECDLALAAFLEAPSPRGYDALAAEEQAVFAALLERADADLLPLLLGRAEATDGIERRVIEAIRACAMHAGGHASDDTGDPSGGAVRDDD